LALWLSRRLVVLRLRGRLLILAMRLSRRLVVLRLCGRLLIVIVCLRWRLLVVTLWLRRHGLLVGLASVTVPLLVLFNITELIRACRAFVHPFISVRLL
jgi:hypothetical protein